MLRPGALTGAPPNAASLTSHRPAPTRISSGSLLPRIAAGVLSGVLLALAFPEPGWGQLAWIALVPLLWGIRGLAPQLAFWPGFAFAVTFHAWLVRWLVAFTLPGYVLLVVLTGALYGGGMALVRAALVERDEALALLVVPAVWVTVEWARSVGSGGFPWGLVGVTQWANLPVVQVASLGGVFAVSGLVVLANTGWTLLRRRPVWALLSTGIVVGAWAWGSSRITAPDPPGLPVAILQPGLPQREKQLPQFANRNRRVLWELTQGALRSGARLIVWPESYWPGNVLDQGRPTPALRPYIPPEGATVVTSVEDGRTNSAFLVSRDKLLGRHDKRQLVPMGEWWATPGPGYRAIPAPGGAVGILVCYESVFPAAARALVRDGARYLVISTEEGWFGASAGPRQHFVHGVIRAVETGRDVVRAASIGISAVIDRYGRIRASLPQGAVGWIASSVVPQDGWTPYVRYGDTWIAVAFGAVALLSAPAVLRSAPTEALRIGLLPFGLWLVVRESVRGLPGGPVLLSLALLAGVAFAHPNANHWGIRGGRGAASTLLALGAVLMFLWLLRTGYGAQGYVLPLTPPEGGWGMAVLLAALRGIGEEVWLRGALPDALRRSTLGALVLSVLGSMVLALDARGEVVAWRYLTGATFFAVRRMTGSLWGPLVARGIGDVLFAALLGIR